MTLIVIPFLIAVIASYTTRDKTEITLKLDAWITIGSVQFGDLEELQLLYKGEAVKNVLKVSWRVINTGNKGIEVFEYGPAIQLPRQYSPISARITDTSPQLRVRRKLRLKENQIITDSLGIFNPGDFFKADIYLRDVPDTEITSKFFEAWSLVSKSLDLSIKKEIGELPAKERKTVFPLWFYVAYIVVLFVSFTFFLLKQRLFRRLFKLMKSEL